MLDQRRRWWANINPTLGRHIVMAANRYTRLFIVPYIGSARPPMELLSLAGDSFSNVQLNRYIFLYYLQRHLTDAVITITVSCY